MSIEVRLSEELNKVREFPKLMIDEYSTIVLFNSKSQGTVVNNSRLYIVGYYSVLWCIEAFKDYDGEITLKNV